MLFGHQNDDANRSQQTAPVSTVLNVNPLALDPATGASLPVAPVEPPAPPEPSVLNQPAPSIDTPEPPPVLITPSNSEVAAPVLDEVEPVSAPVIPTPVEETQAFVEPSEPTTTVVEDPPVSAPIDETPTIEPVRVQAPERPTDNDVPSDSLLTLKQQALSELEPLVDKLDQTPEEKFRTTMMLIQSTDNQALIQDAYNIAQSITDEKVRAQALLDVINEINYFTQQPKA